jgi:hypothetical protein
MRKVAGTASDAAGFVGNGIEEVIPFTQDF